MFIQSLALQDWSAVHSGSLRAGPGGIIYNDGPGLDYHLIRVRGSQYVGLLRLHIVAEPLPGGDAELYINPWGGSDVCRIGRDGAVHARGVAHRVNAEYRAGDLIIDAVFQNNHDSLSIGTSKGVSGVYQGLNKDQFLFKKIAFLHETQVEVPRDQQIIFVDVGAMGGLQSEWTIVRNHIRPVMFEPSSVSAKRLREIMAVANPRVPAALVIEKALFNKAGRFPLYITRHPGCTSLLEPNKSVLDRYKVSRIFDVVGKEIIECVRYDALFRSGEVPAPDVIKVDVQGAEYEVLDGFGETLDHCLAIELETHLYPIYKDQKLLGDIVAMLDQHGFSVRTLREQRNFDGDAVEFNAFFTRRSDRLPSSKAQAERKLQFIENVWHLDTPNHGAALAQSVT